MNIKIPYRWNLFTIYREHQEELQIFTLVITGTVFLPGEKQRNTPYKVTMNTRNTSLKPWCDYALFLDTFKNRSFTNKPAWHTAELRHQNDRDSTLAGITGNTHNVYWEAVLKATRKGWSETLWMPNKGWGLRRALLRWYRMCSVCHCLSETNCNNS